MYPSQRLCVQQQQRVRHRAASTDSYAFFNLLTGPQLFDRMEALLPERRERLFPPTETPSMILAYGHDLVRDAQDFCSEVRNGSLLVGLRAIPSSSNFWFTQQMRGCLL